MAETRSNAPSYRRMYSPPGMRLMGRDREILASVYEYRLLTSHQIEALHFSSHDPETRSRRTACQRRLQRLYHHKMLDRIIRPLIPGQGRESYIYALGTKGADIVAETLGIDRQGLIWRPRERKYSAGTLSHLLVSNTLRVAATMLVNGGTWEKLEWLDELTLRGQYQGKLPASSSKGSRKEIIPDGYFTVTRPQHELPAYFFLEVDMATTPNKVWAEKIKAYTQYRIEAGAERHFGTKNFRILTIAPSHKRLANLQRTTAEAGGNRYFWFTTADQLSVWQPQQLLEPIWYVAGKQEETHPLF